MRMLCLLAALAALAPLSAQTCTLATSGTLTPGDTYTLSLTGSLADAPTLLLVGETQGSTALNFPFFANVTLGLDFPFLTLPFGRTDGMGDASLSIAIPANIPPGTLPTFSAFAQTLTIDFGFGGLGGGTGGPGGPGGGGMPTLPTFATCVSNVVTISN